MGTGGVYSTDTIWSANSRVSMGEGGILVSFIDAQVSDGVIQLRMPQQNLHRSDVLGSRVDDGCFRPPH